MDHLRRARMGMEERGRTCAPVMNEGGRGRKDSPDPCNAVIAQAPVYTRETLAHVRSWTGWQAGFDSWTLFSTTFLAKD